MSTERRPTFKQRKEAIIKTLIQDEDLHYDILMTDLLQLLWGHIPEKFRYCYWVVI